MADVREQLLAGIRDVPDFPRPGIVFKDIAPLLADPVGFALAVEALAADAGESPDTVAKIAGIEARGFILAAAAAYHARAGLVPVRKAGKLPGECLAVSYALEYGEATLEMHRDALQPGDRVLVVDDVLATGGTVAAAIELIRSAGGVVTGVSVLLEIEGLGGRARVVEALGGGGLGGGAELHALLSV